MYTFKGSKSRLKSTLLLAGLIFLIQQSTNPSPHIPRLQLFLCQKKNPSKQTINNSFLSIFTNSSICMSLYYPTTWHRFNPKNIKIPKSPFHHSHLILQFQFINKIFINLRFPSPSLNPQNKKHTIPIWHVFFFIRFTMPIIFYFNIRI